MIRRLFSQTLIRSVTRRNVHRLATPTAFCCAPRQQMPLLAPKGGLLSNSNNGRQLSSARVIDTWSSLFSDGCGLNPPVDIDTTGEHVLYDVSLLALEFDYENSKPTSIVNNGHSFQVNYSIDDPATVGGGPLEGKYQLAHFHGHWGSSNEVHGSEHTINHHSYPSELHFVHFNKDKYETMPEAIKHKDGLVVVGVFLKVCPEGVPHREMQRLVDDLNAIQYTDREMPLAFPINPQALIPPNTEHYFWYPGYVTTQPPSECLTWLIHPDPILVTAAQLEHFHHLHRPRDRKEIDHNFRPVMPIKERIIYASFPNYADHTTDGPIDG